MAVIKCPVCAGRSGCSGSRPGRKTMPVNEECEPEISCILLDEVSTELARLGAEAGTLAKLEQVREINRELRFQNRQLKKKLGGAK